MDAKEFLEIFNKEIKTKKGHKQIVLTTLSNNFPQTRTVIIRDFSTTKHEISVYTHGLSNKVTQILENKLSTLCWYHPRKRIQIRMETHAYVLKDESEIQKHFESVPAHSLKDYLGRKPGSDYEKKQNSEQHFCVLKFQVKKYTMLKLQKEEHIQLTYSLDSGPPKEKRVYP